MGPNYTGKKKKKKKKNSWLKWSPKAMELSWTKSINPRSEKLQKNNYERDKDNKKHGFIIPFNWEPVIPKTWKHRGNNNGTMCPPGLGLLAYFFRWLVGFHPPILIPIPIRIHSIYEMELSLVATVNRKQGEEVKKSNFAGFVIS